MRKTCCNSCWHVLTLSDAGPILPSPEPRSNQQVESKSIAYEMEKCSLIGPGERSRINVMVTMQYKAVWWNTSDNHSYCCCFLCYYYLLPTPLILSHLLLLLCMCLITILTMASVAVCIYVSHDMSVMCICSCVLFTSWGGGILCASLKILCSMDSFGDQPRSNSTHLVQF